MSKFLYCSSTKHNKTDNLLHISLANYDHQKIAQNIFFILLEIKILMKTLKFAYFAALLSDHCREASNGDFHSFLNFEKFSLHFFCDAEVVKTQVLKFVVNLQMLA